MNPWKSLKQFGESFEAPKTSVEDRQKHWLMVCLRRNQSTQYGQRYAFQKIKTAGDYQRQVPLIGYEDIRREIEAVHRGVANVLFKGRATALEWTGGSTSGRKLIPYSSDSFSDVQRAVLPWLGRWIMKLKIQRGTIYWGLSQVMRRGKVGVSETDYLGETAALCLRQLSAVSPKGCYRSMKEWKWDTISQLIHRADLVLVSVWSPTFFMTLLDFLDERLNDLVTHFPSHSGLKQYRKSGDLSSLWPQLRGVSCWMDGSSARYAESLRRRLPWCSFEPKGLALTEGVVTFPDEKGRPRLALDSGFYEFLDEEGALRLAHQLETGKTYEVVMTTSGGLYRYCTGDLVRCTEFWREEPVLRFEGRKGIVSDMVGEKLTEAFVSRCLMPIRGFAMLTPRSEHRAGYDLVVGEEKQQISITTKIEKSLCANPQYHYARRVGQLRPLALVSLKQPEKVFQDHALKSGKKFGDIKIPALTLTPKWWEREAVS